MSDLDDDVSTPEQLLRARLTKLREDLQAYVGGQPDLLQRIVIDRCIAVAARLGVFDATGAALTGDEGKTYIALSGELRASIETLSEISTVRPTTPVVTSMEEARALTDEELDTVIARGILRLERHGADTTDLRRQYGHLLPDVPIPVAVPPRPKSKGSTKVDTRSSTTKANGQRPRLRT